jgi:hypothetical protein
MVSSTASTRNGRTSTPISATVAPLVVSADLLTVSRPPALHGCVPIHRRPRCRFVFGSPALVGAQQGRLKARKGCGSRY